MAATAGKGLGRMPSQMTSNWTRNARIDLGKRYAVHWVDVDWVDPAENDLRDARPAAPQRLRVARACSAWTIVSYSHAPSGGPARLGQVFSYRPSP